MKLFRTAFWLGVVIYYLPSPGFESAPPGSQAHGQHLSAKAANLRDVARSPQDTLTPGDRGVTWRGSVRNRPESKRPS
jgi:hypothetical protein